MNLCFYNAFISGLLVDEYYTFYINLSMLNKVQYLFFYRGTL